MIGSCTGLNFSFRLLLYDRADDGDLIVYPFLYRPLLVAIDIAHRDNTGRGTARSCFVRPTIVDESLNRWCRFHPVCGCLYVYKRQTRIHRIAPMEKGGKNSHHCRPALKFFLGKRRAGFKSYLLCRLLLSLDDDGGAAADGNRLYI